MEKKIQLSKNPQKTTMQKYMSRQIQVFFVVVVYNSISELVYILCIEENLIEFLAYN